MNITQIDYPDCVINIEDESGNYTKLKQDSSGGLTIFTQTGEQDNIAEITSNSIKFNRINSDNTSSYREFGYNTVLKNKNENNELKHVIITEDNINYINNQDDNNLNMYYKGTGIETNNNFNLVSTSDTITLDAPSIDISGQSSFNQPPHSVDPIYGNDLATKGYVDSLVGQYSGGFNLFFNYSVTDSSYSSYKSLGQEVVTSTQQIVDITTNGGPVLVAQFITLPLGINEIPAGLWNSWVYGAVNNTNGELQYFFTVLKFDGTDETLISTSSLSPDVNASPNNNPDSYHMNATITTPYILSLTDRIVIKLYVQQSGGTSVTIRTFFQNSYYSFTQSTLNAGTTLISSNNIWSGTNNFLLGLTTTTISSSSSLTLGSSGKTTNIEGNLHVAGSAGTNGQVLTSNGTTATWTSPTTSQWVNDATSDLSMNTYTIHTNSIYPNYDNNTLNIASNTSRSGTLNLQTGSTQSNSINIGSATTTTTLRGTVLSNNIDSLTSSTPLNIGTTNASGTTIGRINKITNLQGNLHVNGTAGSLGQVLTSDGTTATWTSLTSNSWVNEATSDLNMSNFSIKVDTINPITTSSNLNIALGTGRSGQVNIQTTATGSNTINIGSDNSTTNIKGLKTSSIDTNAALTIGTATTTGITVGKSGITTTVDGTLNAITSTINTIQTTATNTTTNLYTDNIDGTANLYTNSGRSGTLNIQSGSTTANTINIGSATTTTNLYGLKTPSIDTITSTALNIGTSTATGVNVGRINETTNLSGNLQIAGSAGSNGQVLTSNGTTATWANSQWINTATSNLNMSTYSINNVSSIDSSNSQLYIGNISATGVIIGKSNISTIINGNASITNITTNNFYVNQSVILDNKVGRTVILKNSSISNDDNIITINKLASKLSNSVYLTETQFYMTGAVINSGINNYSNTTQYTCASLSFVYQSQNYTPELALYDFNGIRFTTNNTDYTYINRFKIETPFEYSFLSNVSFTMKAPNIYILGATQIDASATQLSIGNTSAMGVLIGRSGQVTNISGNLQIGGSAGLNGQVLTSNGTTASWATPSSGWSGVATTTLDMGTYNIINASSLDTNNLSLKIGNTSASGVIIGRSGQVTDISGNLQIGGSSGTNGQVLTSNGTTASWTTITSGWVGTATSDLNISNYSIINASSIDTNNASLKLGNTSASGVIIGRSGQITNLQGNIYVNGTAGSSGQVLTSNGTTASWSSISSGWVNEATSDLNMSNFSINVNTINTTTTSSNLNIALGSGRSGQVNIQTTATGSNIINIGSDNSTTVIKGLKTSSIDTATSAALTIGDTNATGISIGKAGITTTITGLQANSLTSNIISANGETVTANLWNNITTGTPSILTGATTPTVNILTNSERNGITNIQTGSTLANTVNIGSATTTTNISGNLLIGGSAGSNGQVLTSNGTTATWSAPSWVGTATSNLSMGNLSIIGSSLDATDTNNPILYIGTNNLSNILIGNSNVNTIITGGRALSLISNTITTTGGATGGNLWNNISTATCNIVTSSLRAGITNIQTGSTFNNTINIGSATTTTNISGIINVSTIKNCSLIDNSGTLTIGNTSATSITIGKSGININVPGYLLPTTFGVNSISVIGASSSMLLWSGSIDGTANILNNAARTGITNIQTGSTSANTINIGSATTTTTFNGSINVSFIDTNNLSLRIGNTSSSGVIIGRSGQVTNIQGNLQVAGSAGTNGQVLTSNGTTATWAGSPWNGVATSNLSMTNNVIRIKNTSTLSENRWPTLPQVDGIIIESTSDVNTFNVLQNTGLSIYSDTGLAAIYKDRFSFTDQTIGTTVTNYGGKNIISDSYSALFPDHPFQFGIYGILLKDLTNLAKYDTTGITFANFQSGYIDTIDYSSYNTKINTSQLISTKPYTIENSSTLTINSSTLTINSSTLNLNTSTGTLNTNIGTGTNSGTITIGNSSTTALNIGEPITPTYTTYNATTGTNIAGTIGYIIVGTGTITTSTSTQTAIRTISSLPVGVWLLIGSIHYNLASSWVSTSISTTTTHNFASGNITGAAGANNAHTCTRIVVATTATVSYYLVTNSNSNCTLMAVTFQALRIA